MSITRYSNVPTQDIQDFISKTWPPHLTVLSQKFFSYLDGLLNCSDISPLLDSAKKMFDPFVDSVLPPLLVYDDRLYEFSHYNIRNIVAISMMSCGISFYTLFFAFFFKRFEVFYSDQFANRYESLTGVLYTDEGHYTDENTFTDNGVGMGPACLLASILFDITEIDAVAAVWDASVRLMNIMKPGRLTVFHVPTLDVRLNHLSSSDPDYRPELFSGDSPLLSNPVFSNYPSMLATDVTPPLLTDSDPPLTSDSISTRDYLLSLSNVTVKYVGSETEHLIVGTTYAIWKPAVSRWFFSVELEIEDSISYMKLSGMTDLFSVTVNRSIFMTPMVPDGHMRLRLSWLVPEGFGA